MARLTLVVTLAGVLALMFLMILGEGVRGVRPAMATAAVAEAPSPWRVASALPDGRMAYMELRAGGTKIRYGLLPESCDQADTRAFLIKPDGRMVPYTR